MSKRLDLRRPVEFVPDSDGAKLGVKIVVAMWDHKVCKGGIHVVVEFPFGIRKTGTWLPDGTPDSDNGLGAIRNVPRKRKVRVHIYGDPSEEHGFFTTVGPVSNSKCPLLAVTEVEVEDE